MNKTALDWLRQELEYLREFEEFYSKRYQEFDELFNKAKEIEKEQIIEAHNLGYSEGIYQSCESGEEYYNETFKQ